MIPIQITHNAWGGGKITRRGKQTKSQKKLVSTVV